MDFDTRAALLDFEIQDDWAPKIKAQWIEPKENIRRGLMFEYGEHEFDTKLQNFIDLGPEPFSVLAYHNHFLHQARTAFVVGSNYPALAGTCALGERILNHLMINLRDNFRSSPHYKHIYRKDSFDDWEKVIAPLKDWGVLLPAVADDFVALAGKRNQAIHFQQELDQDARTPALEAIQLLQGIVKEQFSGIGEQPWFIQGTSGSSFIRREVEAEPFVKLVYIPNSFLVSNDCQIHFTSDGILVTDEFRESSRELTDDEFARGEH
jgi:hypothetical protein